MKPCWYSAFLIVDKLCSLTSFRFTPSWLRTDAGPSYKWRLWFLHALFLKRIYYGLNDSPCDFCSLPETDRDRTIS